MSTRKSILVAAVAAALWAPGTLRAADVPTPAVAGPVAMPSGGCATCASTATGPVVSGGCKSCGGHLLHHHAKEPFVVNLCPGSCFGYFQTQWRKWDEVCPYPYQGVGVGDAPRPTAPPLPVPRQSDKPPPKPDGTLPEPRPVDPKMKDMKLPPPPPPTALPAIPIPSIGNGRL